MSIYFIVTSSVPNLQFSVNSHFVSTADEFSDHKYFMMNLNFFHLLNMRVMPKAPLRFRVF